MCFELDTSGVKLSLEGLEVDSLTDVSIMLAVSLSSKGSFIPSVTKISICDAGHHISTGT